MRSRIHIWTLVGALALLAACGGSIKQEFRRVSVAKTPELTGFGWGANAEQDAKQFAVRQALAAAEPGLLTFEYKRVDHFTMFTSSLRDHELEATIVRTEPLPDGGVKAVARATRTNKAVSRMQNTSPLVLTIVSKAPTAQERVADIRSAAYEQAALRIAMRQFGVEDPAKLPSKLQGGLWLFDFAIADDGSKTTATIIAYAKVAHGVLSDREKSEVLVNAWRNATAFAELSAEEKAAMLENLRDRMADLSAADLNPEAIASRILTLDPTPEVCEELSAYALAHNNTRAAVAAMEKAVQAAPHLVDYHKKLYFLLKKAGDSRRVAEMAAKLAQMEVFEEELGEDLTQGMRYETRYKWVDSEEKDAGDSLRFSEEYK